MKRSELLDDLEATGFYIVGYGCTTCIGNSGPLPEAISEAISENHLVVASVLSGNRNFEGRISPDVRANYLASPPLVVAYALAGTVDIDLTSDPIAQGHNGEDVYLSDIWPSDEEIDAIVAASVTSEHFVTQYGSVFEGADAWKEISAEGQAIFQWEDESTYIQEPPFFVNLTEEIGEISPIGGARVLVKVGDSITTDHISPGGCNCPELSRRSVPAVERRQKADVQQLRLEARQRPRHDQGNLRQRADAQRAGAGNRGWLHHRFH